MLRHEAFCSALNGVVEICTCGALAQAVAVQASRVQARERAARERNGWGDWLGAGGPEQAARSPGFTGVLTVDF
jgi:hypothetical protein